MSVQTLPVEEAAQRIREQPSAEMLDVRTPAEYREIHAVGTRLIPLDKLDPKKFLTERQGAKDAPVYVFCRTGNRAKQACEKLASAGISNLFVVEGGTDAWEKAGLPVKRGKKMMSLERQVRIAAGALTLIGSALAYFVHPYFLGVPAFIGAGLVFAGVTDTCGMGILIAQMPWNQVKDDVSCGTAKPCSMAASAS